MVDKCYTVTLQSGRAMQVEAPTALVAVSRVRARLNDCSHPTRVMVHYVGPTGARVSYDVSSDDSADPNA